MQLTENRYIKDQNAVLLRNEEDIIGSRRNYFNDLSNSVAIIPQIVHSELFWLHYFNKHRRFVHAVKRQQWPFHINLRVPSLRLSFHSCHRARASSCNLRPTRKDMSDKTHAQKNPREVSQRTVAKRTRTP